ncbi:fungal specific transcription factor domain-containing protein [Aspergillus clavatus NRRL 1]|uniref:Fungal specific transcription factor domain protein n=1 Tax=Aspergillus clavatus (strain ATCC 1007 / CBS 513.65 / DSM 816 / NCTC 3887 / NRRL 1 / QM 1276 / 107) TaxID=344612 RepID=A1CUM8_ASPCL|nr:fungal specific transcription factor domain protein [Aspergillus clavatus NRRL 1]EAW07015.1 fungal specific transcription factor domain protein [Aspergillus clavatus NRRL 1]
MEFRTLPHAVREIERLRQRVQELEHKLESATTSTNNNDDQLLRNQSRQSRTKKGWLGIHTRTAYSSQTQWYGPSSAFYFIGRMSAYLSAALDQPQDDHNMQPNSACRTFICPTSPTHVPEEPPAPSGFVDASAGSETYLNGIEEDYFLDLFWQSYHPIYQILDEAEFREHYKSLWVDSATTRKPSALVDIILALCMQYGVALTSNSGIDPAITSSRPHGQVDISDASIAGRWYYRRSQSLLTSELESPSITTLQCHIFSGVYLCNASFQNMAHTTVALAVRTAHILGLHLEPPVNLPRPQRELRKRIWWTLYAIESSTCMKLGRPCTMPDNSATCQLPADDHELARLSVSNIAAYGDQVTWLTYSRLVPTLVLAVQKLYLAFFDKCAEVLAANDAKCVYLDSPSLEASAEFLMSHMDTMQEWVRSVPDAMKTKRKGGGEPFSTDRSELDLERYAPLWLQRQRLILELLYHNLSMNLYRLLLHFPSFPNVNPEGTPFAQGCAVSCVNHAIAITHILRQILTSTDFLNGWYHAFQWQWNSTLSMIGFILAYPLHPSTPAARAAIESAITVFEAFGNNFAVAGSAANVVRGLVAKADFLSGRFGAAGTGTATTLTPPFSDQMDGSSGYDGNYAGWNTLPPDEPSAMFQSTLVGAMGLAHNVDSYYSFEPLYAGSRDLADAWNFSHN